MVGGHLSLEIGKIVGQLSGPTAIWVFAGFKQDGYDAFLIKAPITYKEK